ncbi:MAG: phosphohydrolase, partial [Sphingobacteriales bacterium]
MNYNQQLDEIEEYVIAYFNKHTNPQLVYHNLSHTKSVVAATMQIADHYQLSDEDFFIVICSAWFHDMGYLIEPDKHEISGSQAAADHLKHKRIDSAVIDKVSATIMATQMPQKPEGLLQEVLCDADLFHLGTEDYRKKSKQLREEVLLLCHKDISKSEWRAKTIALMESHHYFTDYCKVLLNDQKNKNLISDSKK